MDIEAQPFDLRECVESALDLVSARAVEKHLDMAYVFEGDVPSAIVGDVTRLRQIMLNLLSNAVKFTEAGEVVLTVTSKALPGDKVELTCAVRDTGIGLSADAMSRLFQSFSQADSSTTRKYGGTGLGLAISRRLSELMGGSMWAQSEGLGKGSTFFVSIVAPIGNLAATRQREFVGVQPGLQGKRVLVVDDNATNRRVLTLQTSKWGMAPRATESPRRSAALARARDDAFDLAILDMHMPEMDGVALARAIRARRRDAAARAVQLARPARSRPRRKALRGVPHQAHSPIAALRYARRPARRGGGAPTPLPRRPHRASIRELAARHPLRILLAEDNVVNQKLALRLLQQMGYRADLASNGLEAIESVERQPYDVVLMDVQMPEMDGLDAARAICAKWAARRAPAHRRDDRQRDAGRPRAVPCRGHGRLRDQADPRRPARRRARQCRGAQGPLGRARGETAPRRIRGKGGAAKRTRAHVASRCRPCAGSGCACRARDGVGRPARGGDRLRRRALCPPRRVTPSFASRSSTSARKAWSRKATSTARSTTPRR